MLSVVLELELNLGVGIGVHSIKGGLRLERNRGSLLGFVLGHLYRFELLVAGQVLGLFFFLDVGLFLVGFFILDLGGFLCRIYLVLGNGYGSNE
jgi:hypothetical protein